MAFSMALFSISVQPLSVATSKPASAGHFKTSHLEGRFFDRVGWAEFKG